MSESLFISSLSLSVSILNSQAGLQTFKNIDSSLEFRLFLKSHSFRADDGLDNVLGPSWRHFWWSWKGLGGSLDALGGFLGAPGGSPTTLKMIVEPPLSHQSVPQSVAKGPQEPSKRARWPQDAIKIHAKTSSKQFSCDVVDFVPHNLKITSKHGGL